MSYDGTLIFNTNIDTKGINTGTGKISSAMSNMKNSATSLFGTLGKLGGAIGLAFSAAELVKFGKEAINIASDLQEVENVVNVSFGSMKGDVEAFAKTAITNFGMSELQAKRTASTYMAMSKGMGLFGQQAADMSIEAAKRTGDIASFYNMTQEEADTMLKSIWTGETESLKRIGVVMTQTNLQQFAYTQGIQKNISAMSQAELTQLRYAFVMNQTNLAQGDFIRTQDSWANQTRVLKEQFNSLLGILGKGLIQMLTPAVKLLNNMLSALIRIAQGFSNLTASLFGEQELSNQSSFVDNIDSAVTSEENLEKAAKKAKKAVMGFDEINILSTNKDEDNSSSQNVLPGISGNQGNSNSDNGIISKMEGVPQKLAPVMDALKRLWEALKPFGETIGEGLKWFYDNILVPLGNWMLNDAVPTFLDLISSVISALNSVIEACRPGLDFIWKQFLEPLAKWSADYFIEALNLVKDEIDQFKQMIDRNTEEINNILTTVGTVLGWLWDNSIRPYLDNLKTYIFDSFKVLSDFFRRTAEYIIKAWSYVADFFNNIFAGDIEAAIGSLEGLFETMRIQMLSSIQTMINLIVEFINFGIRKVNALIDVINKIPQIDIPKIPTIPQASFDSLKGLADGGWVAPNKPRPVIVGDNKREGEIIAPESKIEQAVTRGIRQATNMFPGSGGNWNIIIKRANGTTERKVVVGSGQRGENRNGQTVVQVT